MPSDIGSDEPVERDSDDWRDAHLFERSEEARINEADDEGAVLVAGEASFVTADADEADVIEQHQPVEEDDDEEDTRRVGSAVREYE